MTSNPKKFDWSKYSRNFLKSPAALPAILGSCGILIVLIMVLVGWGVEKNNNTFEVETTSAITLSDDEDYTGEDKVDILEYQGTVLPQTEDAGQEYLDETLFIGDSNTARYMVYGPEGSDEAFTSLANNIGVVSMGVQQITTLKCENFVGRSSAVTIPEAVKIMQPRRVIIGFGTNNLAMDQKTFIEKYKEGLAAIKEAYPYADIIVCAIPPLDKQRSNTALTMKQVDTLNAAIVVMCEEEGYKFLDSSQALEDEETGWAKQDYTLSDGVHLSQAGVRAFFEYVRTHAYITEDTRPKLLNDVPDVKGVTPNLITSDPIAVRGDSDDDDDTSKVVKVPVEFVAGTGGTVKGQTSQMVAKGGKCSTVTAVPKEGWEFVGWSATIGSTKGSDESLTFTVPTNADANGVILTANFKEIVQATASPTPSPTPTATPTPTPTAAVEQPVVVQPTQAPAVEQPTEKPVEQPTAAPTAQPTAEPTAAPTPQPTEVPVPTEAPAPTEAPVQQPPESAGNVDSVTEPADESVAG